MTIYDGPRSYTTCNLYDENGKSLGSEDLGELADKLTIVYEISWQSNWRPHPCYQDYIQIYKTPDGNWVKYSYECSGYSSYTFEPYKVVSIMNSPNFDKFWNLILSDNERDHLIELKTNLGRMIYV